MTKKIALVTGGSRGLGRDMALALAQKGSDIVLTYQSGKEAAEEVVSEIVTAGGSAIALQFDISVIDGLDDFVSRLTAALQAGWATSKLDYIVNNAGVGATIPFMQVTEEAFDRLMNIHFKGVFFLTQKLAPLMNDGGAIVNISSGTTRFCVPGYAVYSSLKGSMEVFTKYLAKELGARGIRANIVAPGPIETDFNSAAIRNNPQMKTFLAAQTPLGRVGAADDIGSVVAFLCSEDAKWINGQRLEVSGGINL